MLYSHPVQILAEISVSQVALPKGQNVSKVVKSKLNVVQKGGENDSSLKFPSCHSPNSVCLLLKIEWNINETKVWCRKEPILQMDLKVLWQTPIQRQWGVPKDDHSKMLSVATCVLGTHIMTSDYGWGREKRLSILLPKRLWMIWWVIPTVTWLIVHT